MALDTFAKRLASQLRPSPGDISPTDRWAIGGTFKPTISQGGGIAAVIGAVVASFAGTHTAPEPADYDFGDRVRVERTPYPGDIGVQNRFAIGGVFLHVLADDSGGKISAALGTATTSIRGTATFTPPFDRDDRMRLEKVPFPGSGIGIENRFAIGGSFYQIAGGASVSDGRIAAAPGAVAASLRGESFYDLFFDIEWSLTPTFVVSDITASSGAIAATIGAAAALLQGSALPPDSVSGSIVATTAAVVAHFEGTMSAPAGRDGVIHGDLSQTQASLRGSSVPPDSSIGKVEVVVGGATASLVGTFAVFVADGTLNADLEATTANFNGQFIEAGAIVGLFNPALEPVGCSLRGTSTASVIPVRGNRSVKVTPSNRTFRAPPPKRDS